MKTRSSARRRRAWREGRRTRANEFGVSLRRLNQRLLFCFLVSLLSLVLSARQGERERASEAPVLSRCAEREKKERARKREKRKKSEDRTKRISLSRESEESSLPLLFHFSSETIDVLGLSSSFPLLSFSLSLLVPPAPPPSQPSSSWPQRRTSSSSL